MCVAVSRIDVHGRHAHDRHTRGRKNGWIRSLRLKKPCGLMDRLGFLFSVRGDCC